MDKNQLEELKNIVAALDLNNESDNLESESCESCCVFINSGAILPRKEEELQKVEDETLP